eukprot:5758714-Pyramimonas_sp.AAC.1
MGGEDFAVWMLCDHAGPAVLELDVDCGSAASCPRRGAGEPAPRPPTGRTLTCGRGSTRPSSRGPSR